MFQLKIAEHDYRTGTQMVEIWNESTFMGAIYPTERGIKVVSKFIADNPEGAIKIDRSKLPPIPAILINLV
mgnify:CR=1 FL=1